jgi:hypothetical protein
VEVDAGRWKGPTTPYAWMRKLLRAVEEVEALLPPEATFVLVDEDQWGGKAFLPGRCILPFPERDGEFWGPPSDDAAAIQELERLRCGGADFIVFASATFWWLDYYSGLAEYLRRRFRRLDSTDSIVAFDLRAAPTETEHHAQNRR